jgi:flagellar assembly protein FliH
MRTLSSRKVFKSDEVKVVRDSLRTPGKEGSPGKAPAPAGESDRALERAVLKREYDERLRKAEKDAYAKGLQEGKNQAEKKFRHILDTLKNLIEELKKRKEAFLKDGERDMVKLSLALAEKIVRREVEAAPAVIAGILRGLLKDVTVHNGVKVTLNPVDYLFLQENEGVLPREIKTLGNLRFEADPKLERGDVVVDTGFSLVDARVGEQISAIGEAFSEPAGLPDRKDRPGGRTAPASKG